VGQVPLDGRVQVGFQTGRFGGYGYEPDQWVFFPSSWRLLSVDAPPSLHAVVFLERLQSELIPPLPHTHIDHLGSVYALTHTPNAELRLRFYQVALRDPTSSAARAYAAPAVLWVVGADETGVVKGRMKFCRPVLRAVASVDWEMAMRTYHGYREAFHPIARSLIEKVRVCVCVVGCSG